VKNSRTPRRESVITSWDPDPSREISLKLRTDNASKKKGGNGIKKGKEEAEMARIEGKVQPSIERPHTYRTFAEMIKSSHGGWTKRQLSQRQRRNGERRTVSL